MNRVLCEEYPVFELELGLFGTKTFLVCDFYSLNIGSLYFGKVMNDHFLKIIGFYIIILLKKHEFKY